MNLTDKLNQFLIDFSFTLLRHSSLNIANNIHYSYLNNNTTTKLILAMKCWTMN